MSIFSRKSEVQEPLLDHTIYLIDTENVRTVWTLLLDRMTENDKIYVFYTANSGNIKYEDLNGVISSGKNVELIQCHTGKNGLDFQLVSYLGYLIRNNENADYCIISDDSGYDAVIKFWEGRDVDVTRKTAFQVSGKQAKPVKKSIFGVKPKAKPQTVAPKKQQPQQPKPVAPKQTAQQQPKQQTETQPKQPAQPKAQPKPSTWTTGGPEVNVVGTATKKVSGTSGKKSEWTSGGPAVNIVSSASSGMESKLQALLPDEPSDKITLIADIIRKAGGKKGLADIHDEIEKIYRSERASEIYRLIRHNLNDICG